MSTKPDRVTITIEGPGNSGRYAIAHHLARWLRSQGHAPTVAYDARLGGLPTGEGTISNADLDQMVRNAVDRVEFEIKTVRTERPT